MKKGFALILIGIILTFGFGQVQAANDQPQILVSFISESGATLSQLSQGAVGQGVLLYYLPERGPEKPSIAVRLSKTANSTTALAEVYQAPVGQEFVPIKIEPDRVSIEVKNGASIKIVTLDGWWQRDGRPNFNLDISTYGPLYAMWGADYTSKTGFESWAREVKPNELSVKMEIRDPKQEGLPLWDWRSLMPPFPGRGYYRTNYIERKCNTPTQINLGLSPLWPYVAVAGEFLQEPGVLNPPILVDWPKGRLTHFTELATARGQNCSYTLYALDRFYPGKLNLSNFESPFAFYDLSGQGKGYPNLIVRTQRFPPEDAQSTGIDPTVQQGRVVPTDIEWIRYSWRNTVGDYRWDYKVDVMGQNPYGFSTPLAGGALTVDPPDYESFPGWVLKQNWAVMTFVQIENRDYLSIEGVYDWSALEAGIDYLFGWSDQPQKDAYSTIDTGLRGEYRLDAQATISLYFSPVDHKLHLFKAEKGLWNISEAAEIRYASLKKDGYIDQWVYNTLGGSDKKTVTSSTQLNIASQHLIYGDTNQIIIRQTQVQPSLYQTLPPATPQEWKEGAEKLAQNKAPFSPTDIRAMQEQFDGPEMVLNNASMRDYRPLSNGGFRFVLELRTGFQLSGSALLDLTGYRAGQYLVTYTNGNFILEKLTPPLVQAQLLVPALTEFQQSNFRINLRNEGLEDAPPATVQVLGNLPGTRWQNIVIATRPVTLQGGEQNNLNLYWSPPIAGNWQFTTRLEFSDKKVMSLAPVAVKVAGAKEADPNSIVGLSSNSYLIPLLILALALAAGLGGLLVWQRAWRRRSGKDD